MNVRDVDRGDALGAGAVVVVAGGAVAASSQSDAVGPYLTFAGAILVAFITAYTTNRRQRKQLEADERRQIKELVGEETRLDRQLRQDRELRDVEHMRVLLDEANTALGRADELLRNWLMERDWPVEKKESASGDDLVAQQRELSNTRRRVQLRPASDHPILQSYEAVADALISALVLATGTTPGGDDKDVRELQSGAWRPWGSFIHESVQVIGAIGLAPAVPTDSDKVPRGR